MQLDGNQEDLESKKINLSENLKIRRCANVHIENIISHNSAGDAVNIGCSNNVLVEKSSFKTTNRSGLVLGGGDGIDGGPCEINGLVVSGNAFASDIHVQQIDFEHANSYNNVVIKDNYFEALPFPEGDLFPFERSAIVLGAINKSAPSDALFARIFNNNFNGNGISITNSNRVRIFENTNVGQTFIGSGLRPLTDSTSEPLRSSNSIYLQYNTFDIKRTTLSFSDNLILQPDNDYGIFARVQYNSNTDSSVDDIKMEHNTITLTGKSAINGIAIKDVKNTQIRNNTIIKNQGMSINTSVIGIQLELFSLDEDMTVGLWSNTITGFNPEVLEVDNNDQDGNDIICNGPNCIP